ncbi:MAG: PA2817 family protein, partial [Halioglobus sp.]
MNDEQYLQHCRAELAAFTQDMLKRTASLDDSDSLRELALAFQQLTEVNSDLYGDGQTLVARLFTTYPDFSPTFPRELLWFLGGDCLHYMPDDEISQYQRLEEQREEAASRGEIIDFAAARAKLLKL